MAVRSAAQSLGSVSTEVIRMGAPALVELEMQVPEIEKADLGQGLPEAVSPRNSFPRLSVELWLTMISSKSPMRPQWLGMEVA